MVTVFFDDSGVGFVECTRAVFGSAADARGPVPAWLTPNRTRWMPDYVRMELDEFGIPICPAVHVTSLVDQGRGPPWSTHVQDVVHTRPGT